MIRTLKRTMPGAFIIVWAAAMAGGMLVVAQDAEKARAPRRLPPYYADIVTETQRLKIYALQEEYAEQIDALAAQILALEKKRDLEIEDVLTPAQKERLKQARESAAARKRGNAAANKALEEAKAAAAAAAAPAAAPKKRK
jgi:hypothetical protein